MDFTEWVQLLIKLVGLTLSVAAVGCFVSFAHAAITPIVPRGDGSRERRS